MRKLIVLLLCAVGVAQAAGTTANLTWNPVTTYIDGTPLPASDLKNYTLSWSRASGGPVIGSLSVNAPAVVATVPVPCGGYVFVVTATTGPGAKYPNATSGNSNELPYATGVQCGPSAPTNLTAS